jgi:hypothetical protein
MAKSAKRTTGKTLNDTRVEGRIKRIGRLRGITGGVEGLRGKALQAVQLTVDVRRADGKIVRVLLKGSYALKIYCLAIRGDDLKATGAFQDAGDKKVFIVARANCSPRKPARRRKA